MILKNKAFTLIELLIVIAIIAILTVAFLPGALKAPAKARDAGRIKAINDIATVLDSYAAEKGGSYPIPTNHCLDDTDIKLSALASYFASNKFPVDSLAKGGCFENGKEKMYFYKSDGKFYILATQVEILASSNYDNKLIGLEALTQDTLSKYIGQGKTSSSADNAWYVAYGPK